MAKTKTNTKKKSDPQTQTLQKQQSSAMEETHEKASKTNETVENPDSNPCLKEGELTKKDISSLRTLNEMLVRKTTENREEIKALTESKEMVEAELTRVNSEVESLRGELEVRGVYVEEQVVEAVRREKEEVERRLEEAKEEMRVVARERDEFQRLKFDGDLEIGGMKKREKEVRGELRREKETVGHVMRERDELKEALERVKEELRGKEVEVGHVRRERDELKAKEVEADHVRRERDELREKWEVAVKEKEEEVELVRRESEAMAKRNEELSEEKDRRGLRIGELEKEVSELRCIVTRGKEDGERLRARVFELEESNAELVSEVERVRGENEAVARRNEELSVEHELRGARIGELMSEVSELNCVVMGVRADEEKWRVKELELEESNAGLVSEVEGLRTDFEGVMKVKDEKEREVSRLEGEKARVMASLSGLEEEIMSMKRFHEEVVGEKKRLESELSDVRGKLLLVEESSRVEVEKSKRLGAQVDDHKRALKQVSVERDDVKKALEVEKKNGACLEARVSEILKNMEETAQVVDRLNASTDALVGQKEEIEDKYNKLVEDKKLIEVDSVKAKAKIDELNGLVKNKKEIENKYNKLVEDKKLIEVDNVKAKAKIDELNGLVKNKTVVLESLLTMVKNSVKQLSMENENKAEGEGVKLNEHGFEELKPIMAELEALRSVFKERGEKAGEFQQEMKSLQCSLKEVNKKKSFWTLVSSATTVLAAVASYAYASRVR